MIIKLSFGDNALSHYLETFCVGLRDKMFSYDDDMPDLSMMSLSEKISVLSKQIERYDELKEIRCTLMNPSNHFLRGSKEYRTICLEVKRLWGEYSKTCGMAMFTPDISIQYSLKEQWQNGEVVYYFTVYDRCIVQ